MMMEYRSNLTLQRSFFDDLWPLILENNRCDTHSKNTSPFFVPARSFDNVWAHEYLAKKCYNGYQKPIELCCSCLLPEQEPKHEIDSGVVEEESEKKNVEGMTKHCMGKPPMLRLVQQMYYLQSAQKRGERLADKFVNRQYPWYMQIPSYKSITINCTHHRFELSVLRNLHTFQCRLIIIDVASTMRVESMEWWLKFRRYANILAVVRDSVMARQLLLFDDAFHTYELEEHADNEWHGELMRSLKAAYTHALNTEILKDCAQTFLFAFASKRGLSSCNTFKVLRKF